MSISRWPLQGAAPSRRQFLKTSALAAAGGWCALILGTPGAAAAAQTDADLRVACRDAHLKSTAEPDCWSALKALGANGVEVVVNDKLDCVALYHPEKKYSLATDEGVAALEQDLRTHGIALTALCMNNRFDERLEAELAWMKALLPKARKLRVNAIRLDVVPRALARDKFLPFAIKTCKELCQLADAEAPEVRFAIENHGNTTNDPTFLDALFEGVGAERLGLTLDPNNFYWYGHPLEKVYAIIERFAARSFHTHCKNIKYPAEQRNRKRAIGWEYDKHSCLLADGDLDYQRILKMLRQTKYRGDLCLEIECLQHFPKERHPELLQREIAFLKGLAG